ncbi:ELMO/CED-12 family-domain-containing protein [Crucibulum laeve]|uniref:ELMO/CED-12 family-domain-containing protein n=1 Tax=Crucibulum laeve TaxID=68775 RepID=A0A5C3M665_9AGAR|nr:ELMO/CED-12 family-domain-containing protein [Crucibulum laeve]
MSTAASTRSPLASSAATNGTQVKPGALVPTNNVTTGDGLTVRARIDPTLTVDDVVKQLCINLQIKEPPSHFALRDENDELVTNDNLRRKIKTKVNLKLVNAPAREAKETAEKLRQRNEKLRLTLFSLQKFIREEQFAQEFLNNDGLAELVDVIDTSSGNTLAYALTAMQNLMELDYGWSTLDDRFIFRVVQILSSPQSLINVCRPATAILKKLVEADPMSAPGPLLASSSRALPSAPPGSVYRYGFHIVFEQMRKEKGLLETVVSRLGSADTAMAQYSMMLINSLLAHASDIRWDEFIAELERLNVRKAVVRLMSLHTIEDLTSCILDFQANIVRVTYRKKTTDVDPEFEPTHAAALDYIWNCSKLDEEVDSTGQQLKWRKLGFDTENILEEFHDVGVLGLDCLKRFVDSDPDFSKVVLEQLSRPEERRCPIGKASNEVVELLAEHWAIFAPGYSTSTTFQPFFLDFFKVHSLATHFFLRMWSESGAAYGDFTRVAALVQSQIKLALRSENVRAWHDVEHDFLECEYRAVRDRQMKELELEDDLLSKVPVRNLRAKLYKESFEFVRQQRIQCLLQGAWFVNALPQSSPRDAVRRPSRPWRFMRLDIGMKYLHYVDSAVKFLVRNGLEDLPERIDVSLISEIATGTCIPPPNVLRDQDGLPTGSPLGPSLLSFSLLSAHEGSLADLIAPDQSRWADWTDGLNMLRRDGGHVASKETAGFVQALTEIGLKIKLLDLSGEMVEIPSGLVAGPPPTNTDFFFSELM